MYLLSNNSKQFETESGDYDWTRTGYYNKYG